MINFNAEILLLAWGKGHVSQNGFSYIYIDDYQFSVFLGREGAQGIGTIFKKISLLICDL